MEEVHRTKYVGRRAELLYPLQARYPSRSFTCSSAWQLSEPCALGIFMEASIHRHDWLNHWALGIPLPGGWKCSGDESSNPLIKWLVPLGSAPHPVVI